MARTAIAHKPGLTKEQAQAIFATHFGDRYRVTSYAGPFAHFIVEKNPFAAVGIRLEQSATETKFNYNAFTSRWWARAALGALIGPILGRGVTAEVKEFIETAPEFH